MASESLRILLPLDGSSDAESILASVLPLAGRRPLRLVLLGAVPRGALLSTSEAYLARAEKALRHPDINVQAEICLGEPASAIVAHAISNRSDLIAMATHGRSGVKRLLMGSVAEKVLRQAPVPLMTCRTGCRMEGWTHVVALDGSPRAETILEDIVPLTRLVGATLHLLHVEPATASRERLSRIRQESKGDLEAYLERMSANVAAAGVSVRTAVRRGSAALGILNYVDEVRAGLVAMATHGRTGLRRALMGSVAEEVLRKVACPVLLRRELRQPAPLASAIAMA